MRAKFSLPLLLIFLPLAIFLPILDSILCERVKKKRERLIAPHAPSLARKRAQLVYYDDYGIEVAGAWHKERDRFIDSVVMPSLTSWERMASVRPMLYEEIERQAASVCVRFAPEDAEQYEHFCAEILRQAGWDATVTPYGSDQGADVIAIMNGKRVLLQCKRYSGNVGNKAVQEAIAACHYYLCDAGAVVSNSGYTRSARQLAATASIALLHHDALYTWAQQLGSGTNLPLLAVSSRSRPRQRDVA